MTGDIAKLHYHSNQNNDACALVKKHHYSRRPPSNVQLVVSLHLDGGLFGDHGECVAACFFSIPPTRWSEDVLELSRLVRTDEKIPLTGLISFGLKTLRRKGFDLVVSFADKTQGHHGGIYQAASWEYDGTRERSVDGLIINGRFVPGRSCNSIYGTRSATLIKERHNIDAENHWDEGKHLYWKPLGPRGRDKAARLGLTSIPYQKPLN
jgi:hypothetical protein